MRRRILTLCLAGLALLASAPSLPADPFPSITPEELVGSWSCQEKDTRHVITFTKDGEFKGLCFVNDALSFEYAGTWTLSRDMPYGFHMPLADPNQIEGPDCWFIHYTYTQCPGMKPGTKDADYASIFTTRTPCDTMGIITFRGARREYHRVEEKAAAAP